MRVGPHSKIKVIVHIVAQVKPVENACYFYSYAIYAGAHRVFVMRHIIEIEPGQPVWLEAPKFIHLKDLVYEFMMIGYRLITDVKISFANC